MAANDRHAQGSARCSHARRIRGQPHELSGLRQTALLEATLAAPGTGLRVAVIEGDIETSADAETGPLGIQVVQVNTAPFGGDSHLAAPRWPAPSGSLTSTNSTSHRGNVGNLVCPAEFDIGEDAKVVLLSVTEGEDKPLMYPLMFHEATLAVITKIDLVPYLDVDVDLIRANIRRVNRPYRCLTLSSRSGEGLDGWSAGSTRRWWARTGSIGGRRWRGRRDVRSPRGGRGGREDD